MKKRFLTWSLVLCMLLLLLPGAALAAEQEQPEAVTLRDSGGLSKLSQSEIIRLLGEHSLVMPDTVYDSKPSLSPPYAPGQVSSAALDTAVNRLNALRRIAGLPPVTMDGGLNESAQYGAVLLAVSEFSHYPSQPADMDDSFYETALGATSSSNIHYGTGSYANLPYSVDGFMDDSDRSNIDRLGHRRWQLNPAMGKVGFGYVLDGRTGYVAEKVFDSSAGRLDYDFISWPASGNFPNGSFFHKDTAWSVSLNPSRYKKPVKSGVKVTLERLSDGKTWTFQGNYTAANSGAYFNVENSGYGVSNCIIFRPDGISSYSGSYAVTIEGLSDAGGKSTCLSYQVDFFNPAGEGPEKPEEPAATYTVTFDANGGKVGLVSATTDPSGLLVSLPTPTRDGYTFDGWYTAADGGERVRGSTIYRADTALYAHWTEEHTHSWAEDWSSDSYGHWHDCTGDGCPITANRQKGGYGAHVSDGGTVTRAATETQAGLRTYTCTVCGYVIKTETIPASGSSSGDGSGNTSGDTTGGGSGNTSGGGSGNTSGDTSGGGSGNTSGGGSGNTSGDTSGGGSGNTSGDTSGDNTGYPVVTPFNTPNGVVSIKPDSAKQGDSVTVTTLAKPGYRLESLKATRDGKTIPLTKLSAGQYVFTMPAGSVVVEGSFVRDDAFGYPVTLSKPSNGTLAADPDSAKAGDTVTVIALPGEGYRLDTINATSGGKAVTLTKIGDGRYTFPMPAGAVEVKAGFVPDSYPVSVPSGTVGGTVTADPRSAKAGDTVTVIALPGEGYHLDSINATGGGRAVTLTKTGDGRYTFPMPAGGVEVKADFAPDSYPVSVPSGTTDGIVTADPRSAKAGDTVTVIAVPGDGYRLDTISATSGGRAVTLTKLSDSRYTFTMPAGGVEVKADFAPDKTPEIIWSDAYTDVAQSAWYYDAVRYASENGLMNGYGSGRFGPNDILTRAQTAQILYNKERRPSVAGGSGFTDMAPEAWCAPAISWAAERGILGGYGNGTVGPDDDISREQFAVMLWRYAGCPVSGGELRFTDIDRAGSWALEALRWAVENGILNGKGGGILDPKGPATRAQAAQMLMNYLER